MQTLARPQQSGSIDVIYILKILDINKITRRECAMAQGRVARQVASCMFPEMDFGLLRTISVSRDLRRLCLLMSRLKSLVITCYNSHNHCNHQNRSSRHLRMFCSKKPCQQPAQPESGGQSLIRRSTVRISSIQYCPTGNEMNCCVAWASWKEKLMKTQCFDLCLWRDKICIETSLCCLYLL